jgi:hypothetical protein
MPEVLLVSENDWANAGHVYCKALRSIGIDADAITLNLHGFHYTEQARQVERKDLKGLCDKSRIVISMHSRNLVGRAAEHMCVFHGGAQYRGNAKAVNSVFNPFVDCSIIQTGDLLGLGAKNEVWVLPAIDLKSIKPRFGITGNKIRIGHHPRSFKDKGGPAVLRVIDRLKSYPQLRNRFEFTTDSTHVPWEQSIQRMGDCDIYIECLAPTHLGKKHGAWGITALECAALGKIVVTNFADYELYEADYGKCGLQVTNTEDEMLDKLVELLSLTDNELENLQVDTREWAEKHHSYEAIGTRLWEALRFYCYGKGKLKLNKGSACGYVVEDVEEGRSEKNKGMGVALPVRPAGSYSPRHFWEQFPDGARLSNNVMRDETTWLCNGILEATGAQNGMVTQRVLEVGCGIGNTFLALKDLGLQFVNGYTACDFSNAARYKYRERTHEKLPDFWDGISLSYDDGVFDVVVSTDVMLHVIPEDLDRFTKEHLRVLKNGGTLFVSSFIGSKAARAGKVKLAHHCFIHDYENLWKWMGVVVEKSRVTGDGTRCVWVVRKGK